MARLRRLKERRKTKFKEKRLSKKTADLPKSSQEKLSVTTKEVKIEDAKFYTGPKVSPRTYAIPSDLPTGYGKDKIVLQTRDPWWLHAYWEVSGDTLERLKQKLKSSFFGAKVILRVYDISHIIFDGTNAHRFFDIELNPQVNNWYIDTAGPGRSWCVDLGLRLASGEFIKIVRSNTVHTPLEGPSWITDEEWMIPEDLFSRLYGRAIGLGSSPLKVKRLWEERLKREFGSGALFSISSPVKKVQERAFWLTVNTELIVYGQTEADAKVTIQGEPIKLRPDGSFSLRFALSDGKQVIPVKVVSSDNQEERTITPIVTKETK